MSQLFSDIYTFGTADKGTQTELQSSTDCLPWTPILDAVRHSASLKYQFLDGGTEGLQWLEIRPSSCTYQSKVGPVDTVRIIVSSSLVYQVDVLYPVVRNVERLKGTYVHYIETVRD